MPRTMKKPSKKLTPDGMTFRVLNGWTEMNMSSATEIFVRTRESIWWPQEWSKSIADKEVYYDKDYS